uniref:Uncharacterized protein n=1 Tax=Oryza sativa subsp. japonica TaxID=39947 RepID=Q5Z6L1_ORYSJ|nr:hypothetical protein [Oryza sativa Japonica Group]
MSIWKPTRQGFLGPIRGETLGKESLLSHANNSGRRRVSFSGETRHRRDSSSGEKALASQAPTRGRGGWHRGSRFNADEAARRQRGHTAPSRRGQGGSKAARLTGRGGAEAQIRLLLVARRPPAVARLGLCVPL